MAKLVWDTEANGLLDTVSEIWCLCGKVIDTPTEVDTSFLGSQLNRDVLEEYFDRKVIIGHNIIAYDIPLIKKFFGLDLIEYLPRENIIDTLVWSQTLWPDRPLPRKCPTHAFNPVTGKSKIIGPHSLEAWGFRVGFKKIEIHDWTKFEPEIIDRCLTDVEINKRVYYALCEEAGVKP